MTLFTIEVSKGSSSSSSNSLVVCSTGFEGSTGAFTTRSVVKPFFGRALPAVPGATTFLK